MGRPKGRFTVAKSFTLDIQTAAWMEKQCLERKMKASALLVEIIEKHRIALKREPKAVPTRFCVGCLNDTPRTPELSCTECGRHDESLVEILKRQS